MKVKNLFKKIEDGEICGVNPMLDNTKKSDATTVFASIIDGNGIGPIRICAMPTNEHEPRKFFVLPGSSLDTIFALARCGIVDKTGQYCSGSQTFGPGVDRFDLLEGITYQDLCAVLNGKTTVRNSEEIVKAFSPDKELIENIGKQDVFVKRINKEEAFGSAFAADFSGKKVPRIKKIFFEEKGGTTKRWIEAIENNQFSFLPADNKVSNLQNALMLLEIKTGKKANLEDVPLKIGKADAKFLKESSRFCRDKKGAYSFTMFAAIYRTYCRNRNLFLGDFSSISRQIESAVSKCIHLNEDLVSYRGRFSTKKMEALSVAFTKYFADEEGLM